ncbi:M61 family metallopeptidase [Hufsiella ginkgonis]|uniref:M61 family peptidase n=1 Tax=Hufsiella ginkgonis TaxID=2695274 RepID=A0A7K1Y3W5_9SPHI|nr:M61 family metallopeptidase [Hufsiella ginkgonis]MXV17749.1 M61 family peptidase [Hufsiella ginkgonis]
MAPKHPFILFFTGLLLSISFAFGQQGGKQQWHYTLSFDPAAKNVHVSLTLAGSLPDPLVFRMAAWTPGYYQLMNYAKNLSGFNAADERGASLTWEQPGADAWKVNTGGKKSITLQYDIKAPRNFVAGNFLDAEHGFLSPAGIFLYLPERIKQPVTVTIKQPEGWSDIATGMDHLAADPNTLTAPDFDILFDSPILLGKLETLPGFRIKGIPHNFIAYKAGDFDRAQFMADLRKILEAGIAVIGDIPYKHYTFVAIGPGGGGIEHLNSAAISFNGTGLNTPAGRLKLYSFLAHEYFHHYNVKRIRPIELGPFDYQKENRTESLWVSEGLSVYYEYIMLRRAGLSTADEFTNQLRTNLLAYETKPGRLYQSVTQASWETWSDGPFGRTGDAVNKTISYYDKGPVLGLMLDLKIRHETNNKRSLDDVMRAVYQQYYRKLKRGFTPAEFRRQCEKAAGVPLTDFFEYVTTVKEIDYHTYFAYAGLAIDDAWKEQPAAAEKTRSFTITPLLAPDALQKAIYQSVFGGGN